MDSRSAPTQLRAVPTWLLGQVSAVAAALVSARLATIGAHRYHYSMLLALAEFGPMSQAELGRHSGLDRSDVAAAVADLDGRGLVDRAPDPADRRRNTVRITRAGRRHLQALDRQVRTAQDELLAALSTAEREQLVAVLTRLLDHHAPPEGAPRR